MDFVNCYLLYYLYYLCKFHLILARIVDMPQNHWESVKKQFKESISIEISKRTTLLYKFYAMSTTIHKIVDSSFCVTREHLQWNNQLKQLNNIGKGGKGDLSQIFFGMSRSVSTWCMGS